MNSNDKYQEMLEDNGLVAVLKDNGEYEYQVTRPKVLEEINEGQLIFADGTEGVEAAANEMFSKAQERKNTPVYSGFIKYFPNAIKEVAKCSKAGNDQHHPDKPLHWDMDKSKDELDAMMRHLLDHASGIEFDDDGTRHLTKCAWRAMGMLERTLTNKF